MSDRNVTQFLDMAGIRRPFIPDYSPFIPGIFWFQGTIPDNATTDAIDFRATASQLGWNPTEEDNPDYTLIIDRVNVLAFPVAAEQSAIDALLASSAIVWSPTKDNNRQFNTGHASGLGIGDSGTTVAATTTRLEKLRGLGEFAPLDGRGSLRVNLRNQGLVLKPIIGVNVGAAVPVVVGIQGAYIRNDELAASQIECACQSTDGYTAGYNAGQSVGLKRY